MINFKPIELQDKEIFDKYYGINKDICSEYNFVTLFAWQEMYGNYYAIVNDCLCVKSAEGYMFPIGKDENVKSALEQLIEDSESENKIFNLISITKRMLDLFELTESDKCKYFEKSERRDLFDYVYNREKLVTLSGKKLHGKRNHFNYFKNNYDYKFVDLDDSVVDLCTEKLKELINERSLNPEQELFATLKVLKHRKKLGLVSKCLFVGDVLAGIIMSQKHQDTLLIHIAKSDVEYRGASTALFSFFCEEYFTECEYVNFMEDMGIEGLRKMKLSYYPEFMIDKYSIAKVLNEDKDFMGTSFTTIMSVDKEHCKR